MIIFFYEELCNIRSFVVLGSLGLGTLSIRNFVIRNSALSIIIFHIITDDGFNLLTFRRNVLLFQVVINTQPSCSFQLSFST